MAEVFVALGAGDATAYAVQSPPGIEPKAPGERLPVPSHRWCATNVRNAFGVTGWRFGCVGASVGRRRCVAP